jgi:hypothetical protein
MVLHLQKAVLIGLLVGCFSPSALTPPPPHTHTHTPQPQGMSSLLHLHLRRRIPSAPGQHVRKTRQVMPTGEVEMTVTTTTAEAVEVAAAASAVTVEVTPRLRQLRLDWT